MMRTSLGFIVFLFMAATALAPVPPPSTATIDFISPGQIAFRLDHGVSYVGVVEYSEPAQNGVVAGWAGRLDTVQGSFSMIEEGHNRYARIHLPNKVIKLEPSPTQNGFQVTEIDTTHTAECATGRPPQAGVISAATAASPCSYATAQPGDPCYAAEQAMIADTPTSERACLDNPAAGPGARVKIDALVVYTPAVAAAYGLAAIRREVFLSLLETNAAFTVSKINAQLRLAQ